jgi:hypothetical protein
MEKENIIGAIISLIKEYGSMARSKTLKLLRKKIFDEYNFYIEVDIFLSKIISKIIKLKQSTFSR